MALEDPTVIDEIGNGEDGRLVLMIADAGRTMDADQRLVRLLAKLYGYVQYVNSAQFVVDHPSASLDGIVVLVLCKNEPTEEMLAISEVAPPDEIQSEEFPLQLPVFFDHRPDLDFGPHAAA